MFQMQFGFQKIHKLCLSLILKFELMDPIIVQIYQVGFNSNAYVAYNAYAQVDICFRCNSCFQKITVERILLAQFTSVDVTLIMICSKFSLTKVAYSLYHWKAGNIGFKMGCLKVFYIQIFI